ncbi:regulatory-associated protein of mTOR [Phlebotomus argentipes]|uniref:regulatory-associated protein of mTOR n=1 Tax=Phlebotomus argentipes TaxID=94469 RepID=UPI002892A1E3|nr:regulatory-associated protein of mTOR [Phlebotomus argentipes]
MSDLVEKYVGEDSEAKDENYDANLPLCFCKKRHTQAIQGVECITQSWRMKERMKTVSVALVLCLNVGVDPPDVIKIQPCSRLECWIDPSSMSPQKALEMIGLNLQKQYERWQPRARYKQSLDPTVEDVKKLCTSLRKNAKEERVLFHYNGHGVPRPTVNGEIWVFNRTYTQYIPLSIYDLQTWMGAPSIYVYDCSNAGIIVNSFNTFAEQHEREMEQMQAQAAGIRNSPPLQTPSYKNCIQLAACAANQILPMNPQLPADLFTACLTTPIKVALKWFTLQPTSKLVPHVSYDLIEKIPGQLNDRRTMLGELNWIFTAITDTIAWNTLPRDLFQKLFRQDLLVASLFRNFLLAERILRSYDCTPISNPPLPQGFRHPMWAAWDLALDLALSQLPDILKHGESFQHSPFFEEQLTAFQVWLDRGSEERNPPEQLPIVLQVLLSQVHRLRALELLGRFLDLGPWAVNLALSVGIFPYVLKLLQSSAKELRPLLVFIWTKILAVDSTCQVDLVRDQGHKYFLSVLQDSTISAEYRTQSAFVLACIVHNYPQGQNFALQGSLVSICLLQICDSNWMLRQWLAICLGQLWQDYDKARWSGVRDLAHEKLLPLLQDPVPEVRTAAVFALGTFISSVKKRSDHANNIDRSIAMTLLSTVGNDMSPLVRMELVAALQWMVLLFQKQFTSVFLQEPSTSLHNQTHSLERNVNMKRVSSSSSIMSMGVSSMTNYAASGTISLVGFGSIYMKLWQSFTQLARDPYPTVATMAQKVMDFVRNNAVVEIEAKEATSEKFSYSLPPSPNTRVNYLDGSSPRQLPNGIATPNATQYLSTGAGQSAQGTPPTASPDSRSGLRTPASHARSHSNGRALQNRISEDGESTSSQEDRPYIPIVTTDYIAWAVSQFSRPTRRTGLGADVTEDDEAMHDRDAPEYLERVRRFKRNVKLRHEAREQQRRVPFLRLETQMWVGRTQHTPKIVKFHPYEPQIAVAYRDRITIHDWHTQAVNSYVPEVQKQPTVGGVATQPRYARATSLEFINAHDRSLVLVGYEDGCVRLWRPPEGEVEEPRLVSAWRALLVESGVQHSRTAGGVGLVTSWQQNFHTLVAGGDFKVLRLWDTERELKLWDMPTDADSAVHTISSAPNGIIAAGCADGSVRLFDKRCSPHDSRFMTYMEHTAPILSVCLRDDCEFLISGCSQGNIRCYDIRQKGSVHNWSTGSNVTAISIHSMGDIVACGSHSINTYGLDGRNLGTIRSHEGFMASKIGQTSCLAFHPHRLRLAVGFVDNMVAVYRDENRKY